MHLSFNIKEGYFGEDGGMGKCVGKIINGTVVGIELGWVAGLGIGRNKQENYGVNLQENEEHWLIIVMVLSLKDI